MKIVHHTIDLRTRAPGLHDLTPQTKAALARSGLKSGVATIFCRHTSCSLVIMENASPEVHRDLQRYLDRLVPPDRTYEHDVEGPDDMPSHVKTALTNTSESIPFVSGQLQLGTWQNIYLWEHRTIPHDRTIAIAFMGE